MTKSISIVAFFGMLLSLLISNTNCFSVQHLTTTSTTTRRKQQHHGLSMVLRDEYMQPHFKVDITSTTTSEGGDNIVPSSSSSTTTSKTTSSSENRSRSSSSGNFFHYHDDNDEIDIDEMSTMNTSDLLQRYRSIADYESH